MPLTADDQATALSLVRAHLMDDVQYMSWVPAYVKVRWTHGSQRAVAEHIGGHWRRKAMVKRSIDALACVAKQQTLAEPREHMPPVGRARKGRRHYFV
jgi:hypothetical protein